MCDTMCTRRRTGVAPFALTAALCFHAICIRPVEPYVTQAGDSAFVRRKWVLSHHFPLRSFVLVPASLMITILIHLVAYLKQSLLPPGRSCEARPG